MRYKHYFVLLLILLAWIASLPAKHSDSFLLGNYSNIRSAWFPNHAAKADSITARMQQLGFNATVFEHSSRADFVKLRSLLRTFDRNGIDAFIIDQIWDEENEVYGSESVTLSNYWRFEAEASLNSRNASIDNRNFYINSGVIGNPEAVRTASGGSVRRLPENQEGFALNELKYRWIGREYNARGYDDLRFNVGPEFRFINRDSYSPWQDDTLYVTIAFKCIDYPQTPELQLIRFSFNGYPTNYSPTAVSVNHTNPVAATYSETSYLTVRDYEALPTVSNNGQGDYWDHKQITLQLKLVDIAGAGLLTNEIWRSFINNLNPQVYWMGHGSLEVDYVEFQDSVHRRLMTDERFRAKILERVDRIAEANSPYRNIKYLYLQDEPPQGQFDSLREVYNSLLPPSLFPKNGIDGVITCINMNRSNVTKDSTAYNPRAEIYDHVELYNELASPQIIMFDIYPLKGGTYWNNNSRHANWVQNILDNDLLQYYDKYKRLCLSQNRQFVPIVQSYGIWEYNAQRTGGYWSMLRPLNYMQKCLQLLPMCYGADGIMNYRFQSDNVNLSVTNVQEYSLMNMQPLPPYNIQLNGNWQGMKEANDKILNYQAYLRENIGSNFATDWLSAGSVQTNGVSQRSDLSSVFLDSLSVLPQRLEQGGIDLYDGYIQYGIYKENNSFPYLFLVNRRTEYVPISESGLRTEVLMNVLPSEIDAPYASLKAPSQFLKIRPAFGTNNPLGSFVGFIDPYDNSFYNASSGSAEIEFEAGDGKLLRMCATLPENVRTTETLNHFVVLDGDIKLWTGANVTISGSAKTLIRDNTRITVSAGANLILQGKIALHDNVIIDVASGGRVSFENAECTWGVGSHVIVSGGRLTANGGYWKAVSDSSRWQGLIAIDSPQISLSEFRISQAHTLRINNSNLSMVNSIINVPENALGMLLSNTRTGLRTEFSSNREDCGFFGASSSNSRGLFITKHRNPVTINGLKFSNLRTGIHYSALPNVALDAIDCSFIDCGVGITLKNSSSDTRITRASFVNSQTEKYGTGIYLLGSSPAQLDCSFENLLEYIHVIQPW